MNDKEKNDNVLRTKILIEINEDFHQGDKLNFALESSDIHVELVDCFEDKDETSESWHLELLLRLQELMTEDNC